MNYTKPAVLPAWGETNTTTADMVQPNVLDIQTGFPLSNTPATRQRWNWILNFCSNAIRYLCQRGIADWDTNETYQTNALVIGDDGNTYKSAIANNSGNVPSTSPADWIRWGFTLAQLPSAAAPFDYELVAYAANPALVAPSVQAANVTFEITLNGNCAPTISGYAAGQVLIFIIHQDGTGNWTWTWPGNIAGGAIVPPAANGMGRQMFIALADLSLRNISSMMSD